MSVNNVNAEDAQEPATSTALTHPVPDMAISQANLERMVAAVLNQGGRGRPAQMTPQGSREGTPRRSNIPSPKVKGCWCCGDEGHSRQKCPTFLAIKDKNGGKVPKNYEGAYEKSLKKSKTVSAVKVERTSDDDNEHDETYVWPLLTASKSVKPPVPPTTEVQNRYKSLMNDDDIDDDESELVKALSQLTSKITVGKRKKQKRTKEGLDMARIAAVAQGIAKGEIKLPDLDLDNDAEYECVWALVDSGAGVNCAKSGQFTAAVVTDAPEVVLTTADGSHMPNQGAMRVTTKSRVGISIDRVFYKAPVDMPILSVGELSKEGPQGSNTRFCLRDEDVEDNASKERQPFIKLKGAYFMKLYTRRWTTDEGFGRPANR